ncbi:hypothetical protein H311_02504 [Anncaliia algerae PRA109]|nr:hypothetical protein H311_02504 [Anncaliia algerae PRA109]
MTCGCFEQQKMSFLQKNFKHLWRCGRCEGLKSVFYGKSIYKSKLTINKIIDLIYFWCKDNKQNETSIEIQTKSKKTCLEWYKKLQKLSYYIMKKESRKKIGGIYKIIEKDESKISKRKYNVGRIVRSDGW